MSEVYFAKQDSSLSAEELEKLQVLCIRVGNKLIEKDYVKFNDFFNVLVQLCGDNKRPYIKQTYGAIRTSANDELYNKMDSDDIVRPFNINNPINEESNEHEKEDDTTVELRTLNAIMEDIRSIERDTDGLLDEIMK